MYFRRKRAYLQIVESRREGDQVRQQVIATRWRFEDRRPVALGRPVRAKAMMLSAATDDAVIKIAVPNGCGR